jgi:phosphate transport system substrate-binding protein
MFRRMPEAAARWFLSVSVGTWISVLALTVLPGAAVKHLECQSSPTLSQTRILYVEPFKSGGSAARFRESLTKHLRRSGRYQLVDTPQTADAIVKGDGQIWVKGHITTDARASVTNRQKVYGGFLSVEIVSKDGDPLWSYLVTPSKFAWSSVLDNLASNMAKEMLLAGDFKSSLVVAPGTSQPLVATNLSGAGATFPAPLYQRWFQSFERVHPEVHLKYNAVGSESGAQMLADGSVDFAASDVSSVDTSDIPPRRKTLRIASVLGAIVPIYNLPGLDLDLKFTPEALADIYLGNIKKWNDPRIKNSNRGADLPDADILVIHRSDGSGTTYAFSDFLSKTSPNWQNSVGTGTTLKWPVGSGMERNEGVASAVRGTPNSIGYVELVYAIQHQLSYGAVRNSSGKYVRADLNALAEAAKADTRSAGSESPSSIVNAPGENAYPIATFTWLLFPTEIADPTKKRALLELLQWALTSGQKECSALGYAPLPRETAIRQLEILNNLK